MLEKLKYLKFRYLLYIAVLHWSKENYDRVNKIDKKILELLKTVDDDTKRKTIRRLKTYIEALGIIAKYQVDNGVYNQSLADYSDFCLNNFDELMLLENRYIADFASSLIIANISAYKMVMARTLYDQYIKAIDSELIKARLYERITTGVCGDFPMDDADILFSAFESTISDYEQKIIAESEPSIINRLINDKRNYMRILFVLSKKLNRSVNHIDSMIIDEMKNANNSFNQALFLLCDAVSIDNKYHDEIMQLIQRIELTDENQQIKIENLKRKIQQVKTGKGIEIIKPMNKRGFFRRYQTIVVDSSVPRHEVYKNLKLIFFVTRLRCFFGIKLTKKIQSLRKYYIMKISKRSVEYWVHFEEAMNCFESVADSDTVYFFANDYSLVNATVALPFLLEAKRNKYMVVPTSPRTFKFEDSSDPWLNDLSGALSGDIDIRYQRKDGFKYDWKIDIENKSITAGPFNIYQPVFEFISRYQFSYFYNYDSNLWARAKTHDIIRTFDRIIQYCEEIEDWAVKNGKKVRFVSNGPHIHVAAVYRIYCEAKGYKNNLEFIAVSPGYDNYFKNIGDAKTETVAALNLTQNPYSRSSFLGTKEGFEAYYNKNKDNISDFTEKADKWLKYQRSHIEMTNDSEKKKILDRIHQYKRENKKVYLLNGKVVFDLGVKYTKGCVHSDMADWITHTVKTINNNPDVLLLVKPHPHELRPDLTLASEKMTMLIDLIKVPLGDNVIYLDHNMFRNSELTEYVDLGILWNGTSALEFAALEIKTFIGDEWGHFDYPLGFIRLNSLEEYEKLLNNPDQFETPVDLRSKAIMFLNYMGSKDVCINNKYSVTTSMNTQQFSSKINMDEVRKLTHEEDVELKKLFKIIDQ